ncbi:MAG: HlyD family secretion protein [Halioglobus sp.]
MNIRSLLFALGLVIACAVVAYLYIAGDRYVSTDNAYLKFTKVTLSAEVSGNITDIAVEENQHVRRGELLITVDDAAYKVALEKAQARLQKSQSYIKSLRASYRTKQAELALAVSNQEYANREYQRERNLSQKKLTSEALIDDRRHSLEVANENRIILEQELAQLLTNLNGRIDAPLEEYSEVMEAQSDLDLAQINLEHTKILAPFDGFVSHLPKLGQHIDPGSPILSLVSDSNVWVEANFKETELVNLRVNQPVDISIDSYPGRHWQGVVESLSPATGAEYSVLPPQNASGNWIKVVQRVPVRIRLLPPQQHEDLVLRAGMSAVVQIDTRHTSS